MMGALSLRVAPSPRPSASFVHPTPRDDCQRPACAHNSHVPLPTSTSIGSLSDSVLIHVISYLTGGARETTDPAGGHVSHAFHHLSHKQIRVQLGDIRAVALHWSVVATADELWEPVVLALWPVTQSLSPSLLPSLSPSMCRSSLEGPSANSSASLGLYPSWRFHGTHSFHELCLRRGRAIVNPGLCLVTPQWSARYRLHFHIFEERHSIPLFSGEGPLVCQEWQNHHEHRTILRLGPGAAVVTSHFSASGCGGGMGERDVEGDGSAGGRGGRRQRVERFLTYGVAIRVTVIEAASGREALIYQSSSRTDRHCQEAAPGWPVPPHSIAVTDRAETWMSGKGGGASLPPLRSLFDFTVIPVGMTPSEGGRSSGREGGWERRCLYEVHAARVDPPVNTIAHTGIVGLVFLGHVHEVGLLLASLQWA
ncbi:hypothetical protein NSK_008124 [Nannochloropsis salina CCMP1776]|uniref:Uncharacterized protein n=1 Tax=Nannochloropsis salina CCMP1776 TaxID=1027361 RepID=A0A4D9CV97_9STRA|nr:hypothetical protein NSK_008124 [Nannochloropsis salina CCMP1776]|eukprot:TFJ80548.1 hypothetical protein NSK_008124 [Nannochloropsis salina CCMP1776]